MRRVLFSPIGNSDPWRNNRDGAMLHITRVYQPDLVVLFFTKSIWDDRVDTKGVMRKGHNQYNWKKIIQSVSANSQIKMLIEKVEDEHSYDSYKEIFHDHLVNLENEFSPKELLLNVTSGTPQMGTTLCLEYVTNPQNKMCIQVSSPQRRSNAGIHYSTPELEEIDMEIVNEEEEKAVPRTSEIQIISFREALIRSQLISLIDNYDYEGARLLMIANKKIRNADKINSVLKRLSKNIQTHQIFDELEHQYTNQSLKKALVHYLLLNMRFKRREYADVLIRGQSIAEFLIENYLVKKYPKLISYRLNRNHKAQPFFNQRYSPKFLKKYQSFLAAKNQRLNYTPLGMTDYLDLLFLLEKDSKIHQLLKTIDRTRELRNEVAHRLDRLDIDQSDYLKLISESVQSLKEMLFYVYPEINEASFSFFDQMNDEVKKLL